MKMLNDAEQKAVLEQLAEARHREDEFFARHGFPDAGREMHETGKATPALRDWVKAVEHEYKLMGNDVRVHLDMPISRKAFLLGWLMRDASPGAWLDARTREKAE